MSELSHFDENGASRMVDVSQKLPTARMARASAIVQMRSETLDLIQNRKLSKGDVLEVSRLAGIMAAKQTPQLIPLCHSISISSVEIDFEILDEHSMKVTAQVRSVGQTGVEMETLTSVSVAALTIYDMCKAVDREMSISNVQLDEKSGGKSGHFVRGSESGAGRTNR